MDHEITKAISCNTTGHKKQIIETALNAKIKQHNTGNGENYKKDIITFKSMFVFGLMMICVKIPHQSVHDVLVREPGNAFHK